MIRVILMCLLLIPFSIYSKTITLDKTNFVSISSEIDSSSVAIASSELMEKCYASTTKELYLVLNSPGGSVSDGKLFIDFVKGLPCKVHSIALFAASMAYQIFQSLDNRYVIHSSVLMSHRASVQGIGGQIPGELITLVNYLSTMVEELEIKTAERIGISLSQYKKEIYDELWLTHDVALRRNHADESVLVRCSKALSGKTDTEIQTMFGAVTVTFSNCPLITGPLAIKYGSDNIKNKKEIDKEIANKFNYTKSRKSYEY